MRCSRRPIQGASLCGTRMPLVCPGMAMNNYVLNFRNHILKYDIGYIVLLALAIRVIGMQWMGYTDFPEFYRDYHMTAGIATGSHFPLFGPPSMLGGFHFGPFYYYAMAPLLLVFGFHPLGLIATGIIISALTVWALFKLVLLWTNNRSFARLAAMYTAVSVYSLHLASYTSNPNFLPLFVVWYFYCLTKVLKGAATTRDYIWWGLLFALATQLHATAMLLLPIVTMLAFLILRLRYHSVIARREAADRRSNPRLLSNNYEIASSPSLLAMTENGKVSIARTHIAISAGAALLVYAPYLIYDGLHGFSNLKQLFVLGGRNLQGGHVGFALHALWNFFEGTLTPFNYVYNYTTITPNYLYWIVSIVVGLVLLGVLYGLRKQSWRLGGGKKEFTKEGLVLVWLWFVVQTLVLLLYSRAAHDHYLIIFWPLPMILLAYLTLWLRARFGVYRVAVCAVLVVSALQIYSFYSRAGQDWSGFFPKYNTEYKNMPNISEIGSKW
jgi:hypothetical protein